MFKKILNKIEKVNGKKTIGGVLLVALGTAMFNFPFTAPAASYILGTGLATLGFGAGDKYRKHINNKNKDK